ncbi:MAG: hypothetical protein V7L11_30160, partial [Nostoc sp.]|uniref:hypothetical protein n=1 Tax=Nostoc sp. TaxID=1180 RepID=UPI002FF68040
CLLIKDRVSKSIVGYKIFSDRSLEKNFLVYWYWVPFYLLNQKTCIAIKNLIFKQILSPVPSPQSPVPSPQIKMEF